MNKTAIDFIFTKDGFVAEIKDPVKAGETGLLFEKDRQEILQHREMLLETETAGLHKT